MSANAEFWQRFECDMPGGGFLAIEITATKRGMRSRLYSGKVMMERRAQWRADGHEPPVIATASGEDADAVLRKLLAAAKCDPAIVSALRPVRPPA